MIKDTGEDAATNVRFFPSYKILIQVTIGTSVGVAVGRRSGAQLAMMIVDRKFHHSFLFSCFSPSSMFLIERVLGSKNLFNESARRRRKERKDVVLGVLG